MPIIDVKVVAGTFGSDQKRELLARLTDAVAEVYPGLRDVTFVTIEDVADGGWSIAGDVIDADAVAAHSRRNLEAEA